MTLKALAITACCTCLAFGQGVYKPLTLGERARIYANSAFGPATLGTDAIGAAIDQWRNIPVEWGQGMAGFGRRFGSSVTVGIATNAVEFSVSALRHEDTRYTRSGEKSFWKRARYIIVHTYIVPKGTSGRTTFAWSRICGAVTSGFIVNAWYPPGANTPSQAAIRSSLSFVSDMGTSALSEFWPDIRRIVFRRKK